MHHSKRPSPTSLKRTHKLGRHSPRVIQVNRDVATMVDGEIPNGDEPIQDNNAIPDWTPDADAPTSFRPRTFSDGFVRNSSEELLLGVTCEACRSRYRTCGRPWNGKAYDDNIMDSVCYCDRTYPPPFPFDVKNIRPHPSYHRSLDRRHGKTKSFTTLTETDASLVKKIKRNLKRIGGDGSSRRPNLGLPLDELPSDFAHRKSESLVRQLKVDQQPYAPTCLFPSQSYLDCSVESNFDYNESSRRFPSIWKDTGGYLGDQPMVFSNNYREPTVETIEGGYTCHGLGCESMRQPDGVERDILTIEGSNNKHCLCNNHAMNFDKKRMTAYFHTQDEKQFPPAPDVTAWTAATGSHGSQTPGTPSKVNTMWPNSNSQSSSVTASSSRLNVRSKQWSLVLGLVLVAGAAGVAGPIALRASAGAPLAERLELATRLLHETPLIDGHNDLPWNIRKFLHNRLKDFKFDEDLRTIPPWSTSPWSHTDLPRLKQGKVSAQFWAAYVPCDSQHRDAVQLIFEQIDLIRRLTDMYQPTLTLCTTVEGYTEIVSDGMRRRKANTSEFLSILYIRIVNIISTNVHIDGFEVEYHNSENIREAHASQRVCSLVGVEGGHALGASLGVLRMLYRLGVRYLTLTSTCNTPWADCAPDPRDSRTKPEHGGLTPFGKLIVKEMNRLGMIVDLSHVSLKTMKDAIAVSKAPVIFSHSSAHALCNSTRNVPDSILRRVAANRGLVMVNFYSKFLSCTSSASIQDAIAHINHIKEVAGIDNVGLGAGYDGINYTPRGLEDVASYPLLFAELMANGWSIEELKKLAGLNMLRVMEAVERVSEEHKAAGILPYEDTIQPRPPDLYNCSSEYDSIAAKIPTGA